MADVTVKVEMLPGWERTVKQMGSVKSALTAEASAISANANSLSSGFRTGIYHDPAEGGKRKGGTPAQYASKPAKSTDNGAVALVYTANYAAQKDNMLHNTLLKAVTTHG